MKRISTPLAIVGGVAWTLVGSALLSAQALKKEAAEPEAKGVITKTQEVQARRVLANMDAQRQQMIRRLRPFLRAEYHVVRTICEATPEQRREVARAGERALRDAAARNPTGELRIFNGGRFRHIPFDPAVMIREGLAKAVKEHLPPEQVARYQDERKRREQTQEQLAVRMVVSTLDQEMRLGEDQRASISKSLLEHWDDSWAASLTNLTALQNLQNFFPPIPDELVVPFLSAAQKDVWQSNQSKRRHVIFGVSHNGVDPGIEDEELTEAREAEDRLREKAK